MTNSDKLTSRENIHPGSILLEELKYRRLTKEEFASKIGVPVKMLISLTEGDISFTEELAKKVGKGLGQSPLLWTMMQRDYDLCELKPLGINTQRSNAKHNMLSTEIR